MLTRNELSVSKKLGSVQLTMYWKSSLPGRSVMLNRCPPPRNARPLISSPGDSGKSVMSKFRWLSENSPKMPVSEPAAIPKLTDPVLDSRTSTSTSRKSGLAGSGSWTVMWTSLNRRVALIRWLARSISLAS
jgi:hypothetical protein